MNPNLDRDIINDHITASVAELDKLSAKLADLRRALIRADMSAVEFERDSCKEGWSKLALKTRALGEVHRRVGLQTIRAAMAGVGDLAQLLFDDTDSPGDEVWVSEGPQLDFVVAAVWRGVAAALKLDPASLTPPSLTKLPEGCGRLRPRLRLLLSDADRLEAQRLFREEMRREGHSC